MNRKEEPRRVTALLDKWKKQLEEKLKNPELLKTGKEELLKGLLSFGIGFFFAQGSFLFGSYPFGISLLASADSHLWGIWAGCCLGSFFARGFPPFLFISLYTLILTLRLTVFHKNRTSAEEFSPGPLFYAFAASLLSLVPGLYTCIAEDFTIHALFALLVSLLASGVFTFLFKGVSSGIRTPWIYQTAATGAFSFALVYSLGSITFFGFSPNVAAATLCCLLISAKENFILGGIFGVAMGIACGGEYIPVFLFVGMISSAFHRYSPRTAPWLGILAGFAFAFYNRGASAFLYVLPDLASGALVYLPLEAFLQRRKTKVAKKLGQSAKEKTAESGLLPSLSTQLKELSGKVFSLSEKLRSPTPESARRICRKTVEEICGECSGDCFKDGTMSEKIADTLFEVGSLSAYKEPVYKSSLCEKKKLLCDQINNDYASYLRTLLESDKAECYAQCYSQCSKILKDRELLFSKEQEENSKESERFRKSLERTLAFRSACAYGTRQILFKATGIEPEESLQNSDTLQKYLENALNYRLSPPEFTLSGKEWSFTVRRVPAFQIQEGAITKCKEEEDYSGDTVYTFKNQDYFYALLCDGMGSGREAALVSRIACQFFKHLLSCGASLETVLGSVNDFLLHQSCECSTTLDMVRFDLLDGQCDFIKCGACPSLVLRGDNTFKISSTSLPVGATREVHYEKVTVRLRPGDKIILISDGISSQIEGSPWLSALLSGSVRPDPQGMAEDILRTAFTGAEKPDDRSVLVLEVSEC